MCGIAGKIGFGNREILEKDVREMTRAIAHRGPDGEGVFVSPDGKVGLGHRRLAIIDLSPAGAQPMQYKNRYWITFNGEIYNFQEERRELEKKGYRFASNSDTEVILALYDAYQEKCLEHLRGMFAFALYDAQEQVLFCARDRAGQKPFKYYFDGQVFLFASELKAILTQPEYHAAPDPLAIHHYLTYQYVPGPATGFTNIKKLEPGHYLRLEIRMKKMEIKKYWQLDFATKLNLSVQQWEERLLHELGRAVQMQLMADVPLGAFLSGGIDSSTIVALMGRDSRRPVKTFSIGFEEEALNELAYASQVAKFLGTDHTEFVVRPQAVEILPEVVTAFEEPYADSSAIPTYYLSQLTRQHVTVALTGDGGDENFAGYARYNFHKFALLLDQLHLAGLASRALKPVAGALEKVLASTFSWRAERFAQSIGNKALHRYVSYLCYFTNEMKNKLYQPAFAAQPGMVDSYHLMETWGGAEVSSFNQALLADITSYLPDDLLVKVDIASMMHSLEARSPFLDHKVMELAACLPAKLKLKGYMQNKYILKRLARRLLPAAIVDRRKMGFILPIETWFRGEMKSYIQSILLAPNTRITQEWVRRDYIEQLLKRHTSTNTNLAPPLWALLTLELWMRRFFP